jgi:hypothetical protein
MLLVLSGLLHTPSSSIRAPALIWAANATLSDLRGSPRGESTQAAKNAPIRRAPDSAIRVDHRPAPRRRWTIASGAHIIPDQLLISRVEYADYGDWADPRFLVRVDFEYEERPDSFSDCRAGFEIRTSRRCAAIRVCTHAVDGIARTLREYRFDYEQDSFNGTSLLVRIDVVGVDDQTPTEQSEHLPPLTFGYTTFDPSGRGFQAVTSPGLPSTGLSDPTMAFVDLRGNGLSDIVELSATPATGRTAALADSACHGRCPSRLRTISATTASSSSMPTVTAAPTCSSPTRLTRAPSR